MGVRVWRVLTAEVVVMKVKKVQDVTNTMKTRHKNIN